MLTTIFRSQFFAKSILVLASTLLCISLVEFTFRVIEHDFGGQVQSFNAWPIYYRKPTFPVGEVYFRRPGPETWRGKVLSTGLKKSGGTDKAYIDEPVITVTYDEQGFRNPDNLINWDIVVVGDSFTELGYLPYEEMFSSLIGRQLNAKVKNLGVSFTGPLSYNYYLKEYGKSEDTKIAVMIFFEGNDLDNMREENELLEVFNATGERSYRNVRQSSFVREFYYLYRRLIKSRIDRFSNKLLQNAYFDFPGSESIPVTLGCVPPDSKKISKKQLDVLDKALADWSETAKSFGMTPWSVFMPCKIRVLDGFLRFTDQSPQQFVEWRSTDFPEYIRELSTSNGIEFIDATPVLKKETADGKLTYNTIFDSHLNSYGSFVVAQIIANEIGLLD